MQEDLDLVFHPSWLSFLKDVNTFVTLVWAP
jgi:hypothetical protein